MWIYTQSTGEMFREDGDHPDTFLGYSGFGDGKNNPAMQKIHNVGPIPRGFWTIGTPEAVTPQGPFVLPLAAEIGTETHGRTGFLIHGDSIRQVGAASHGCIILARHAREAIAASGDDLLKVVA